MGFDESLPFTDEGFEFIGGEIHSAEIGQTVLALDFVHTEFDFTESVFFVVLKVGQGDFKNTAFKSVIGGF
jgi:hypothetical protein